MPSKNYLRKVKGKFWNAIKRIKIIVAPANIWNISADLQKLLTFSDSAKNGRWYHAGEDLIYTTLFTDQIIAVDRRDVSLAPHLILKGIWEMPLTRHCEKIVKSTKSPIIFDVGANFGWYGLILSRFSPDSRVHFFEANPNLINLIEKTSLVNGIALRSKINNFAVSSSTGKNLNLSIPSMHKGSATTTEFNTSLELFHENLENLEIVEIPSIALDDYCSSQNIKAIDFLKIDVEGAEGEVILGGAEIISKSPFLSIMMEWNKGRYSDNLLPILRQFSKCEALVGSEGMSEDLTKILHEAVTIKEFENRVSEILDSRGASFDLFFHKALPR